MKRAVQRMAFNDLLQSNGFRKLGELLHVRRGSSAMHSRG